MLGILYGRSFYRRQIGGSLTSAEIVLPLVFDLLHPRSVLDIGCGVGPWLAVARKLGASRIVGYDGPHVRRDMLVDDTIALHTADLETASFADLPHVDLAMSLECAEHVSPEAGHRIVTALCRAASAVLFSAAIPGQGGRHHLNERWQSYWLGAFRERGFEGYDVIRPACWENENVEPWYAQNSLLYLNKAHGPLRQRLADRVATQPDIVCPRMWNMATGRLGNPGLKDWVRNVSKLPLPALRWRRDARGHG